MNMNKLSVKTMAEYFAEGKNPDILYWVGSAVVLMIEQKK